MKYVGTVIACTTTIHKIWIRETRFVTIRKGDFNHE